MSIVSVCLIIHSTSWHSLLTSSIFHWFSIGKSRARSLFPRLSSVKFGFSIVRKDLLPRRIRGKAKPALKTCINGFNSRSYRLLSSLDELEREVRDSTLIIKHTTPQQAGYKKANSGNWSETYLRISLERARQVNVRKTNLTSEFLNARDGTNVWKCRIAGDWMTPMTDWEWYKRQCGIRQKWAKHLSSNLDWDWDTADCLKRLFKIEKPTKKLPLKGTACIAVALDDLRGHTIQVAIGSSGLSMPMRIQIPYEDETGEIRYRTFHSGASEADTTAANGDDGRILV